MFQNFLYGPDIKSIKTSDFQQIQSYTKLFTRIFGIFSQAKTNKSHAVLSI